MFCILAEGWWYILINALTVNIKQQGEGKGINNNTVSAYSLVYLFISRIPLPGPRFFALQMLQNCTPGINPEDGKHSL